MGVLLLDLLHNLQAQEAVGNCHFCKARIRPVGPSGKDGSAQVHGFTPAPRPAQAPPLACDISFEVCATSRQAPLTVLEAVVQLRRPHYASFAVGYHVNPRRNHQR